MTYKTKQKVLVTILSLTVLVAGGFYINTQLQQAAQFKETIVEPEPTEPEADYSWMVVEQDPNKAPAPGEADDDGKIQPGVTVSNEDGVVKVDRTWGSKPDGADSTKDPDKADANMGSGGGEMPLDDDGVYHGEPDPAPPVEPTPEPTPEPKPEPIPEPVAPPVEPVTPAPEPEAPTDTPKDGDTKVDENGQEWFYDSIFGWIEQGYGGGVIDVDTDIIPGQGGTIGTFG